MATKTSTTLKVKFSRSVPDTVEEFDVLAKKTGATLQAAINQEWAHGTLGEFRDAFCEKVESELEIERLTKPTGKKDAKEEDILEFDEKQEAYISRVVATLMKQTDHKHHAPTEEEVVAKLQAIANSIPEAEFDENGKQSGGVSFDPSVHERAVGGPKKLAKRYTTAAEKVIAAGKKEAWIAKYGGTGEVDEIARKMDELERAEREKEDLAGKFV
jgi:hypothetical protein